MKKVFVKPKKGTVVIDPVTRLNIPDEGAEVTFSTYFSRRIKDGDLIVASAPSTESKSKKGDK
jgi:hypothetical protein